MPDNQPTGPERISATDLRTLIHEIVTGRDSPDTKPDLVDAERLADTHGGLPLTMSDVYVQIEREQGLVNDLLESTDPVFVITAGGTRRVHLPECFHVRNVLRREEAWRQILDHPEGLTLNHMGLVWAMPEILNRAEVESFRSYVACQVCAPTLNHQKKLWVLNNGPMLATSLKVSHIGRWISTPEGKPLGDLISHQRIVTVDGMTSITTTTETVIEGDGTEKYVVGPKV